MDETKRFLHALYADSTEHNVELRSVKNEGGSTRRIFTRDMQDVEVFIKKHDKPGRAVYFGVATRRRGSPTGERHDCVELPALWVDIDCQKDGIDEKEALDALTGSLCPCSMVVRSGGGLHGYWIFNEALNVDLGAVDEQIDDDVVGALKQMSAVFAADQTVCDIPRILRLPGTTNTKRADPVRCEIIHETSLRYELDDLQDWLDIQSPILKGAVKADAPASNDDPYVKWTKEHGGAPIDVERMLDEMTLQGTGDTSIHQTQLLVSASLVSKGWSTDEICAILIAATERAAGVIGERWNWKRERKHLERMVADARKKFNKPEPTAVDDQAASNKPENDIHTGDAPDTPNTGDTTKDKKATGGTGDKGSAVEEITEAVVSVWTDTVGPLLATGGELYWYQHGVWQIVDANTAQWMDTHINKACIALGKAPNTSNRSNVRAYIRSHPALYVREVDFDKSALIVCENGTLDPATGTLLQHNPEHYCTAAVSCAFDPAARSKSWETFLSNVFSTYGEQARGIISYLQEITGSLLVRGKPRDLTKALILVGPSRSGKTVLASVVRALIGGQSSSLRVRDLGGDFGLQPLIGARSWVGDDAIGIGDELDAEAFKVVVTGEETSVRRKNRDNWEGHFDLGVCLTANALPRVDDLSTAVYNRLSIIHMNRVFHEGTNGTDPYIKDKLHDELSGILTWAVEGWRRLSERGRFETPSVLSAQLKAFADENNPYTAWMDECLEEDEHYMVARADLVASMHGWLQDQYDTPFNKLYGNRGILNAVRAYYPNSKDIRHASMRFISGIKLTNDGLDMREYRIAKSVTESVTAGTNVPLTEVNKRIGNTTE